MKRILLSVLLAGSIANARIICVSENLQSQTILVIDGTTLGAICQRSTIPNVPKKSNEEICAKDMFVTQASSSALGKVLSRYVSTATGVVIDLELSKNQGIIDIKSNYQVSTLKGANAVSLLKGKLGLTCK